MKKNRLVICSLLAMLGMNSSIYAQQGSGELNIMISDTGPITLMLSFFDELSDSFKAAFQDYSKESTDKSIPGMISVGYSYKVNNWLAVGGDLGYTRLNKEVKLTSKDGSKPDELIDRKTNTFIVMPTGKFYYMQKNKINLYGLLGVGALFANKTEKSGTLEDKQNITTLAFQINPIGLRVGNRFGGFAELGFGMKGFATAGFSMRL